MTKDKKKTLSLIFAALLVLGFLFLPCPAGLSRTAMYTIGVFIASLVLWVGVSIDWPCFIVMFLAALIPGYGFTSTLSKTFGNSTLAFLLFSFILVYPLSKTNFVKRTAIAFITNKIAAKGPWHFVSFLLAAEVLLGLFISPSVLFVAFLPFLEEIYKVLELKENSRTANMLMIGSVFCISLSSGMTPIGHVWPTLAMGAYASAFGRTVSPFAYMAVGIPCGIVLTALLILVFKLFFKPDDIGEVNPAKAQALKGSVPKADAAEKFTLAVVALVVVLWVAPSLIKGSLPAVYKFINDMTTAMPPLLGCILLFLVKPQGKTVVSFREAATKGVMWEAILMTGTATLIGGCLTDANIGISAWLSDVLGPVAAGLSPAMLVLFFCAWVVIQTNFASNIVTTTVVSSIAVAILAALPAGTMNPAALLCLIGFGAAICNMTPAAQSTINTVAIGSGRTSARDLFLWGGIFAVLAIAVMSTLGYALGCAVM